MIKRHFHSYSATVKNLRRLFWLRTVMIGFLTVTALVMVHLNIPLRSGPVVIAIGGMLLLNVMIWFRLGDPAGVSETELLVQLMGDIVTLTTLFYFTGGYSNPFVWMYLLPLAIAAVALRTLYVWLIAVLAVASYSMLVFFHIPLSHLHVHAGPGMDLDIHLIGMWLGFVVSAGIIASFVTRIGQNLREYDRMTSEARETALEGERILALGALATAAAHELGTPLSTMAVITKEMSRQHANQPELHKNLNLLRSQVDRCKAILASLTTSAGQIRGEGASSVALDDFLAEIIERWKDTRPAVQLDSRWQGTTPTPRIIVDRTLGMALVNLLDNAADASPVAIDLKADWNNTELSILIRDYGAGLSSEAATLAGTPFFSTKKESGMGLGLYLARMILARFGGAVELENHADSGTVTSIHLPLKALIVEQTS